MDNILLCRRLFTKESRRASECSSPRFILPWLCWRSVVLCTVAGGDFLQESRREQPDPDAALSRYIMNRYEITAQIGDGTFGRVMKATNKQTSSTVAIKQIKKKMKSWNECISLREIQTLREISHPNIVTLLEVILENDGSLYFVFEYMADGSLYELMKICIESKSTLSNARVITYVKQILQGLQFLHEEKHCFHRDIKPENVLVSGDTIKLADFGLARSLIDSNPQLTYYVSTRWYRAPEVILRASSYGPPIDLICDGLDHGRVVQSPAATSGK